MKKRLSLERIQRVVDTYLSMDPPSKEKAMVACGYGKNRAAKNAYTFFKRPDVKAYLEQRQAELSAKAGVKAEDLIERLKMIAFNDLSKFMVVQTDGTLIWNFKGATPKELSLINELSVDSYAEGRGRIKVPVKKFKISTRDQLRALEMLGRMVGAFQDKVELSGEVGVIERLQAARRRTRDHAETKN